MLRMRLMEYISRFNTIFAAIEVLKKDGSSIIRPTQQVTHL